MEYEAMKQMVVVYPGQPVNSASQRIYLDREQAHHSSQHHHHQQLEQVHGCQVFPRNNYLHLNHLPRVSFIEWIKTTVHLVRWRQADRPKRHC
jgi:hypothetical protein